VTIEFVVRLIGIGAAGYVIGYVSAYLADNDPNKRLF